MKIIYKLSISFMLYSFTAQAFSSVSCRQAYQDKSYIKISEKELPKHSTRIAFGMAGVIAATAATIVTAGAATPLTLPLCIISIGLAGGGTACEALWSVKDVRQFFTNRNANKLITAADEYEWDLVSPAARPFTSFYEEFFAGDAVQARGTAVQTRDKTGINEQAFSETQVSMAILAMDKLGEGLCEISDFESVDGNKYFHYLSREEIATNISKYLQVRLTLVEEKKKNAAYF